MLRRLQTYQLVIDALIGVFFFAVTGPLTLSLVGTFTTLETGLSAGAAIVLTAVFSAALTVRRLAPPISLGLAWFAAIVQMCFALPPLPGNLAIFAILYSVAAYGSQRLYWAGLLSSGVGAVTITLYIVVPPIVRGEGSPGGTELAIGLGILISAVTTLALSWTAGALVRSIFRARDTRVAQEQAEAVAAAEAERSRIARDMHDVVAHSLAVVIAQADGARYAAHADPDAAPQALTAIASTARAALTDVRLLLGQLRHRQAEGPQPTLGDLEKLYADMRATGAVLRVDVDPAPVAEPPASVQLAVYRILQESLTNALRHGTPGPVTVALAWHADRVQVTVSNPATEPVPVARGGSGHGLIGMTERANLVGGSLTAGRNDDNEFVVSALLPLGPLS